MSLLRYEDLCISFGTGRREKFAVNHLNLEIGIGERILQACPIIVDIDIKS